MAKKKATKSDLSESVHRIWLAGLGALATAEEEGGKLFSTLVSKGKQYESTIKKPVDRAATRVKGTVKEVRGRAGQDGEEDRAGVRRAGRRGAAPRRRAHAQGDRATRPARCSG